MPLINSWLILSLKMCGNCAVDFALSGPERKYHDQNVSIRNRTIVNLDGGYKLVCDMNYVKTLAL